MNKKGLSGVVSVVLIVLLGLGAIALVWGFISPFFNEASGVSSDVKLKIIGFNIIEQSVVIDSDNNVSFLVERLAGGGGVAGIVVVLKNQDGDGVFIYKYEDAPFSELERKRIDIYFVEHSLSGNVTRIEVFPTLTGEDGNPVVGSVATDSYGEDVDGGSTSGGILLECQTNPDCYDGLPSTSDSCVSGTCENSYQYYRVFVTSVAGPGKFSIWAQTSSDGLIGGDEICQVLASNAGLNGTWVAWLSNDTDSPLNRFVRSPDVEYQKLNGVVIANNWDDLVDGNLTNAINVTENGGSANNAEVWTGTNWFGALDGSNCQNWVDNSFGFSGLIGNSISLDDHWTDSSTKFCAQSSRIYCFEQPV